MPNKNIKLLSIVLLQFSVVSLSFAGEPIKVKSIGQLEQEYEANPKDQEVSYEYCGKLNEHKKYKKAVEVCTAAIETGNENTLPWSYLSRGVAYKNLGEIEKAKKDREKSKELGMPTRLLNDFLKL